MPIQFVCSCKRQFNVADHFAGKKTRCPDCDTLLTIPSRYKTVVVDGPDYEVVDKPPESPAKGKPSDYEVIDPPPSRPTPNEGFEVVEMAPEPSSRRRRKNRELTDDEKLYAPTESSTVDELLNVFTKQLFGIVMMLIALFGLVITLISGGKLLCFSPGLFVLGLILYLLGRSR